MKITIDTKEDSKQEIKRALDFLNTLVELEHTQSSVTTTDIFASAIKDTSVISSENSQPQPSSKSTGANSPTSQSSTTTVSSSKSEKPSADIFDVEKLFEDEK